MAEKLASLRKKGGSAKLNYYHTTATGSGASMPVTVTGKVKFIYCIGNYSGHVMARTGTDHDVLFQYDFNAEYHSDYGAFSQSGTTIYINTGSSANLNWDIYYWSE